MMMMMMMMIRQEFVTVCVLKEPDADKLHTYSAVRAGDGGDGRPSR
jgi:hypothetical protein